MTDDWSTHVCNYILGELPAGVDHYAVSTYLTQ